MIIAFGEETVVVQADLSAHVLPLFQMPARSCVAQEVAI